MSDSMLADSVRPAAWSSSIRVTRASGIGSAARSSPRFTATSSGRSEENAEALKVVPVQVRLGDGAYGTLFFEHRIHQLECGDLLRIASFFLRSLESFLDDVDVREDALRVKCIEVSKRIRITFDGRVLKVSQHEAQGLLIADLLEATWRQALLV